VSKGDTTAQTPGFGSTFKALSASIDQMGHVVSLEEHTITLPAVSVVNSSNDLVLNSVLISDTTGALSFETKKIGSLLLTDYQSTSELIAETDSINGAF
jgi:hypothetical protein